MFAVTLHIETALSWIFPRIFPRHCLLFDVCEMLVVLWTLIFVHVRDWSTFVRSSWFQAILRHILPHVWCLCGPIFVSKNAAKRWHAFVTVAALVRSLARCRWPQCQTLWQLLRVSWCWRDVYLHIFTAIHPTSYVPAATFPSAPLALELGPLPSTLAFSSRPSSPVFR